MSANTQGKLLRVSKAKPSSVSAARNHPVDVRVIAATHRNLELAIHEKQFRETFTIASTTLSLLCHPCATGLKTFPS